MFNIFVSFKSLHSGQLLGACLVRVALPAMVEQECDLRELHPDECFQAYSYQMTAREVKDRGLEVNRFYKPEELDENGHVILAPF